MPTTVDQVWTVVGGHLGADGVAPFPLAAGKRFVDEDDGRRVLVVELGEQASTRQPHAERRKHRGLRSARRWSAVRQACCRSSSVHREARLPGLQDIHRHRVGNRRSGHARRALEPFEQGDVQPALRLRIGILREVGEDLGRHDAFCPVTRIDLLEAIEAEQEQTGADGSTTETATCATISAL